MLNFDEKRFLSIQTGAVGLAPDIGRIVGSVAGKGLRNLFFLGTGGAAILMQPAARFLSRRSTLPVFTDSAAELVLSGHPHLGGGSLVVIPSLSGTTKESVEALHFCRKAGATIVSLVGHADTPLAREADHTLVNFAEDDTSCESFYLQSYLLALAVLASRGEAPGHERIVGELATVPGLLLDVKRAAEPQARGMATRLAAHGWHIITGAGATWPQAFYYGMCILEEMQWIRTRPVHASDFFHGTLELVEEGVSVVVLKDDGETRPLAERVEAFARRFTTEVLTLDTRDHALPGLSADTRAIVAPAVLATVLERVSAHLEVLRDHPLTTRRYYKRVSY
jgi:fructoselysine-6-phosphate deglycase